MLFVALWWLACAGAPERQSFAIAGTVAELKANAVVLDDEDFPGVHGCNGDDDSGLLQRAGGPRSL